MRTEEINIYKFSELSDDAKQKAIEQFHDINTDYNWWEWRYEDMKELCKTIGVIVDLDRTYFSGFSHQGSGSSFTAYIHTLEFLNGINSEAWKAYAPNAELDFCKFDIDRRVLAAIENGGIDLTINVKPTNREASIYVSCEYRYQTANNDTPRIDRIMETLETDIETNLEEINHWFYRSLEKEYEWRTSEEQIIESIVANDFEFTADGKMYH